MTDVADDMYPSESNVFDYSEPQEQKQERKRLDSENKAAEAKTQKLIERLQKRVDYWNSPKSIGVDLNDDPALHQKKVLVAEMMSQEIQREVERLQLDLPD